MDTEPNSFNEPPKNSYSHHDDSSPAPARKTGSGWKIFWAIFTALSVITNIILIFAVIGLSVMVSGTFSGFASAVEYGTFAEQVIEPGSRNQKIAVINIAGLIGEEQADNIAKQVKAAAHDNKVKAIIVRIDSPGGTVSASDRINYELKKLWKDHDKPTVAFLQGIAASGGYYSAVACQRIIAEPTAITGSIGVLMQTFVVQGLLEEKLGIQSVIIKAGEKKDWPNPFTPVTEEQKIYLQDKLISPAYERFVSVIIDGRKSMQEEQIRQLADEQHLRRRRPTTTALSMR